MIPAFALVLAGAGFMALALAMQRHQRQVWRDPPSGRSRRLLRLAGSAGLAGSFATCIGHAGWSIGPVLWFGLLAAAGLAVVLLLAGPLR